MWGAIKVFRDGLRLHLSSQAGPALDGRTAVLSWQDGAFNVTSSVDSSKPAIFFHNNWLLASSTTPVLLSEKCCYPFFSPNSLSNASFHFSLRDKIVLKQFHYLLYVSYSYPLAKDRVLRVIFHLFAGGRQFCSIVPHGRCFLKAPPKGVNKTLQACDPRISHRSTCVFHFQWQSQTFLLHWFSVQYICFPLDSLRGYLFETQKSWQANK